MAAESSETVRVETDVEQVLTGPQVGLSDASGTCRFAAANSTTATAFLGVMQLAVSQIARLALTNVELEQYSGPDEGTDA